jgi:hypothetical protein
MWLSQQKNLHTNICFLNANLCAERCLYEKLNFALEGKTCLSNSSLSETFIVIQLILLIRSLLTVYLFYPSSVHYILRYF